MKMKSNQTRQVYNGPRAIKVIAAILSVYQYSFMVKKIWVKVFGKRNISH